MWKQTNIYSCVNGCQKILVEGNLPQSWPWKQNDTIVVVAVIILEEACYR